MYATIWTTDGDIRVDRVKRGAGDYHYCCVSLGDLTIHVKGQEGAAAAARLSEALMDAAEGVARAEVPA